MAISERGSREVQVSFLRGQGSELDLLLECCCRDLSSSIVDVGKCGLKDINVMSHFDRLTVLSVGSIHKSKRVKQGQNEVSEMEKTVFAQFSKKNNKDK